MDPSQLDERHETGLVVRMDAWSFLVSEKLAISGHRMTVLRLHYLYAIC